MVEITDEMKKKYLSNPYKCPSCRSENIEGREWEPECLSQSVVCLECDLAWWDIYKMIDIEQREV